MDIVFGLVCYNIRFSFAPSPPTNTALHPRSFLQRYRPPLRAFFLIFLSVVFGDIRPFFFIFFLRRLDKVLSSSGAGSSFRSLSLWTFLDQVGAFISTRWLCFITVNLGRSLFPPIFLLKILPFYSSSLPSVDQTSLCPLGGGYDFPVPPSIAS